MPISDAKAKTIPKKSEPRSRWVVRYYVYVEGMEGARYGGGAAGFIRDSFSPGSDCDAPRIIHYPILHYYSGFYTFRKFGLRKFQVSSHKKDECGGG